MSDGRPECRNPLCGRRVPPNDGTRINLGLPHGYCSLGCRLEGEDLERLDADPEEVTNAE